MLYAHIGKPMAIPNIFNFFAILFKEGMDDLVTSMLLIFCLLSLLFIF